MKNIRGQRVWAFVLALCMIVGLLPALTIEAKAVDTSVLTCEDYISNTTASYTARANADNELFIKTMQYSDSAYAYFYT